MMRFLGLLIGCLLSVILLAVAGVGVLYYLPVVSEFPGGMRPSYSASDYDRRLTQEASTAKAVIAALDQYRRQHSVFPANTSQFAPYLPPGSVPAGNPGTPFVCGWYYSRIDNGTGYYLSRKLGWDPTLRYEYRGSAGSWVFDPGDGSPSTSIVLKP
jgi:hypothetical protein